MHDTARAIGGLFLSTYARPPCTIVELGAMNVNGALRDLSPREANYIGLDVEAGSGVDVVIDANTSLPLQGEMADIVISSSMFEHDNFFWLTFLEMIRITKPDGAIYINVPSNGSYHRYPVDNWRFYPDSGKALERWARYNGHTLTLVESFIAERRADIWNDFVAIFVKSDKVRIDDGVLLSRQIACTNAWQFGETEVGFPREATEDMVLIEKLRQHNAEPRGSASAEPLGPSIKRYFQGWLKRKQQQTPLLIPHVGVTFPNLLALLKQGEPTTNLAQEIRILLETYISRWPFDEKFYTRTYSDVANALRQGQISSGYSHFLRSGYLEERMPVDPYVDEAWYLKTYPDVAAAIQGNLFKNAVDHFLSNGYREGRRPSKAA